MTRVEDIQNRLSAATPGPWTLDRYDHGGGRAYVTDPKRRIVCDAFKENDREFLFNSASDMAYLLAELRKAREALAKVDLALDAMDAGVAIRSGDPRTKSHTATLIRAAVAAAKGDERG
jgi:hypothetical protein